MQNAWLKGFRAAQLNLASPLPCWAALLGVLALDVFQLNGETLYGYCLARGDN